MWRPGPGCGPARGDEWRGRGPGDPRRSSPRRMLARSPGRRAGWQGNGTDPGRNVGRVEGGVAAARKIWCDGPVARRRERPDLVAPAVGPGLTSVDEDDRVSSRLVDQVRLRTVHGDHATAADVRVSMTGHRCTPTIVRRGLESHVLQSVVTPLPAQWDRTTAPSHEPFYTGSQAPITVMPV